MGWTGKAAKGTLTMVDRGGRRFQRLVATVAAVAAAVAFAAPAWGHREEGAGDAGTLVRQAIALLSSDDVEAAKERLHDALEADETEGVDLDLVRRAVEVIDAGDLHQGRELLERSIGARPHLGATEPKPIRETAPTAPSDEVADAGARDLATGAEPGAELISQPLDPQPELDGGDWALLGASLVVGLAGVYLALRLAPRGKAR